MTQDEANQQHRRSIRLREWDYTSAGAYFLTIVTYEREHLFGTISNGEMILSPFGVIVQEEWLASADIRQEITLDTFIVMPNHLHGIVWLRGDADQPNTASKAPEQTGTAKTLQRPAARSIGAFVGGFKAAATRRVNEARGKAGALVWQRNYYERVIRNERERDAIRVYIQGNPVRWNRDPDNQGWL